MKIKKALTLIILSLVLMSYTTCFAKPWIDDTGNVIEVPDDYEEPVNYVTLDISQEKNSIIIQANKNSQITLYIYPENRFAQFGADHIWYPRYDEDMQNQAFVDENNRTQIPLRFMSDTFKCNIEWDSETNSATVTSIDGNLFKFTDGSNILTVNGEETIMDTTARLINGKLYVPIRYLDGAMADISFHMFEYSGIKTVVDIKR